VFSSSVSASTITRLVERHAERTVLSRHDPEVGTDDVLRFLRRVDAAGDKEAEDAEECEYRCSHDILLRLTSGMEGVEVRTFDVLARKRCA
jgi:hypothetical protein